MPGSKCLPGRRSDRRWLIGHAVELANSKIDLGKMRADIARHAPAANMASKRLFNDWLDALQSTPFQFQTAIRPNPTIQSMMTHQGMYHCGMETSLSFAPL
ncbi:MAG: hypothetical protein ACREYE_14175 [Gammaproteobacteria bacterium]